VARTKARNFYYSFLALPRAKRRALCAIYAFMRFTDDISDRQGDGSQKAADLNLWREALDNALAGDYSASLILPAFHDTVRLYAIPREYFDELIAGAEMDLRVSRYPVFAETYRYCYRVASVVGLVCIQVFGLRDRADLQRARELAECCGVAFQLTNILRDLKEDAAAGRVYLPLEDLDAFGYSVEELSAGAVNEAFLDLMRFQVGRARAFYDRARELLSLIAPDSRPALWAMMEIYRGILGEIERQGYNVFAHRIGLGAATKWRILLRAWLWRMGLLHGLEEIGDRHWRRAGGVGLRDSSR
jgi:phytoene synthase